MPQEKATFSSVLQRTRPSCAHNFAMQQPKTPLGDWHPRPHRSIHSYISLSALMTSPVPFPLTERPLSRARKC